MSGRGREHSTTKPLGSHTHSPELPSACSCPHERTVGGRWKCFWCSDVLLVLAELLKTVDAEVPAAPEPSAPEEEAPSTVTPTAPPLCWDEKSECVVCMEREVRARHTRGARAGVEDGVAQMWLLVAFFPQAHVTGAFFAQHRCLCTNSAGLCPGMELRVLALAPTM